MIRIVVNGSDLSLYRDTSFVMELNNPVFSTEAIEGDVVYNFDIPVDGNELVFGFSHLPYAQDKKTYDCLVFVDGVQLIHGNLIIQKSTPLSYSVAIVVNPFPEGWADRSVRDNEDEEIVIARSYETHRNDWVEFLQSSLEDNSDIKFGMFQDEEGYGDANESFQNHPDYPMKQKLVNRLYVYNGQVVNVEENNPSSLFGVLWNKYSLSWSRNVNNEVVHTLELITRNVFAFCPQFRARMMVRRVVESFGYGAIGALFSDSPVKNVFIQSLRALDGTSGQYTDGEELAWYRGSYNGNGSGYVVLQPDDYSWVDNTYYDPEHATVLDLTYPRTQFDYNPNSAHLISANSASQLNIPDAGLYRFSVNFSIPPCDRIMHVRIMIYTGERVDFDGDPRGSIVYLSDSIQMPTDGSMVSRTFILPIANSLLYSVKICREWPNKSAFVDDHYENRTWYITIDAQSSLYIRQVDQDYGHSLNIYARRFSPMQYLPDVSNAEFLKTMRNSLGLTYYFDHVVNAVEVGFVKDLTKSGCVQLDSDVLDREISKSSEDGDGYRFQYCSLNKDDESHISEPDGSVESFQQLPDPYDNIGLAWYVGDENAFYMPELVDCPDGSMAAVWTKKCNADQPVTTGNGGSDISPVADVPEMVMFSTYRNVLVPDVPVEIESDMFGTDPFDNTVLLMYRGKQSFVSRRREYQVENMRPFSPGMFNLTTSGDNSLGVEFIYPWIKILGNTDFITHRFLLSIDKVLEVMRLLRPQNLAPEGQTRFVMVHNVRILPKKISIQIDNSGDLYYCEIQGIRA